MMLWEGDGRHAGWRMKDERIKGKREGVEETKKLEWKEQIREESRDRGEEGIKGTKKEKARGRRKEELEDEERRN